jgi:hypothetical protein
MKSDLRKELKLLDLLNIEAKMWSNYKSIVEEGYFLQAEAPDNFYNLFLKTFSKIANSKKAPEALKSLCNRLLDYFKNNTIKNRIYEEYRKQDRQETLKKEIDNAVTEGNITGAKLSKDGTRRLYNRMMVL